MNKFVEAKQTGRVLFISHMGAYGPCIPNSMPSFRYAMQINADGIETDLHGTKDGEIVIMHDDDVKAATGMTGKLTEMTMDEVNNLDLAMGQGEKVPVPTLRQLLELTAPRPEFLLILELKDYPELIGDVAYKTVETIVSLVEEFGMRDRVLFLTLSTGLIMYLHRRYGDRYAYAAAYPTTIMKGFDEEVYRYCTYIVQINVKKNPGPNSGHDWSWAVDHPIMSSEKLDIIKSTGAAVAIGISRDTKERMKQCIENDIKLFMSNYPDEGIQYLHELGVR